MVSKTFVEMTLGLPNVLSPAFLVELALAERDSGVCFLCVCVCVCVCVWAMLPGVPSGDRGNWG